MKPIKPYILIIILPGDMKDVYHVRTYSFQAAVDIKEYLQKKNMQSIIVEDTEEVEE